VLGERPAAAAGREHWTRESAPAPTRRARERAHAPGSGAPGSTSSETSYWLSRSRPMICAMSGSAVGRADTPSSSARRAGVLPNARARAAPVNAVEAEASGRRARGTGTREKARRTAADMAGGAADAVWREEEEGKTRVADSYSELCAIGARCICSFPPVHGRRRPDSLDLSLPSACRRRPGYHGSACAVQIRAEKGSAGRAVRRDQGCTARGGEGAAQGAEACARRLARVSSSTSALTTG
jgi:hypothetical protein